MSSFFGEESKVKIEAGTSDMEFSGNGAEERKSDYLPISATTAW
jgi:hypothetical protein